MIPHAGDRVRVTGVMADDPDPIPVGTEGTVTGANADVGQIYVDWDAEPGRRPRGLILLTSDPYTIVRKVGQ